jgi:hypothetical protein
MLRGQIVEAISHRAAEQLLLNLWHPHHADTRMKFQCGCALLISSSRLQLQKIEANALSSNQGVFTIRRRRLYRILKTTTTRHIRQSIN